MKRSLNEIDQTSRKAARGCGLPWGIADEVGKSVRWLHVFGIAGANALTDLFRNYDHSTYFAYAQVSFQCPWRASSGVLSPLLVGPTLGDFIDGLEDQHIKTEKIAYPILAAGFLGQAALDPSQTVQLSWNKVTLELHRNMLIVEGDLFELMVDTCDGISCRRISAEDQSIKKNGTVMELTIGDVDVDDSVWTKLDVYAHRTYVEATDENRMAGAGAGLLDND